MSDQTILPAEDDQLDVDVQLAQVEGDLADDLVEGDEFDLVLDEAPDELPPLGKGYAFDFTRRQFVRAGRTPAVTHGDQTLREWVAKAIHTERGAHPIHSDEYGMDDPFRLIGSPVRGAAVAQYEQDLVRCLTTHPRIADVRDFGVTDDEDGKAIWLTFLIVLDDDTELSFDPFQLP